MHDKLYETQSLWGLISTNQQSLFEGYAKELSLNLDQFKTDYASEEVASRINRDVSSAQQLGVTGTPSFILNGKKIPTPTSSIDAFIPVLDEAVQQAESK